MKKLLDTNIVSHWMRGELAILEKLNEHKPYEIAISTITLAEILYGIEKSPNHKQKRKKKIELISTQVDIFSFKPEAVLHYAQTRCFLEKNGIPISERDLQIASIALAKDFILVTHNTSEFSRIKTLKIEDWRI